MSIVFHDLQNRREDVRPQSVTDYCVTSSRIRHNFPLWDPVSNNDHEGIITMTNPNRDSPEMFADVINRIQSDLTLSATKRRDCVSALKSLARMLDLDPSQIPANTDWLRQRLKSFHPKQARISDKRYANIKSCVAFALRHTGAGTRRAGWLQPMSPEWKRLYHRAGTDKSRYKLSRLFRWCTSQNIAPNDLGDKHIDTFEAMLVGETLTKDPHKSVRNAVNQCNRYGRELAGWPTVILSPRRKRERSAHPIGIPFKAIDFFQRNGFSRKTGFVGAIFSTAFPSFTGLTCFKELFCDIKYSHFDISFIYLWSQYKTNSFDQFFRPISGRALLTRK